jgi:GNAT superfamily N-acetyltransferase
MRRDCNTIRGMPDDASAGERSATSIRAFSAGDLDAAGALLADRHRRHRLAEPLLDPAYEDPAGARREIEALLAVEGAAGWTAERDGALVGYVIGIAKADATWGRNVWVEPAGHAAVEPAVVRGLYAVAGDAWAAEERFNQHVLVPASDEGLVDAWFSLDFGQQHLHAVREHPPASFGVVPRSELVIRRARRDDIPVLAELELVLPRHMQGAPVFSRLKIQPIEEIVAEFEADFDSPDYTLFVAEHEGRVIADAVGCALTKSSGNNSLIRPANAGFLGYAAVLPEARGLGAGRALGETIMAWSRDAGFSSVTTDWRSTNIEADRSWRGLGFRPTFRRMHRSIM